MSKFGYRLYDCNDDVSYAIEISQALYTAEEGFVSSYQRCNVYVPAGRCLMTSKARLYKRLPWQCISANEVCKQGQATQRTGVSA